MIYSREEWALRFRERSSPFGADPNVGMLAQAAASALTLRGWQDPETQTLVGKWQSAHGGIAVDGHYGPQSAKALAADLGEASPPAYTLPGQTSSSAAARAAPPPAAATQTSSTSAPASSVKLLAEKAQALLMTKGWKDPATKAALRAWQVAHGGIPTEGTYDAIAAAALSVDIGGPALSPFYVPSASAAHPGLVAVVEAKAQEQVQKLANSVASLTGSKPPKVSRQTATTALAVGGGAAAILAAVIVASHASRTPRPAT